MNKPHFNYQRPASQLIKQWKWQNLCLALFRHAEGTHSISFKATYYNKRSREWVERKTLFPQEVPVVITMFQEVEKYLKEHAKEVQKAIPAADTHHIGDVAQSVLTTVTKWRNT